MQIWIPVCTVSFEGWAGPGGRTGAPGRVLSDDFEGTISGFTAKVLPERWGAASEAVC